ncbi:MAG TPA: hypothetical protein VK110_00400 [Salinisphaeraceae bacterium]|nr:hypothetical protein [Salinisphaeraceae bacterium]
MLERHGRSFASELGVDISRNTPSPLFRVFTFALLASTRISADIAMHAARALAAQGWTTAAGMAQATWRERTDALNRAGYARYDEKTSSQLADSCAHLLDQYHGDLRQLRQRAERDPGFERKRLKQCKGIGDVGVDIFFRETQAAWPELYPFADKLSLRAARHLELGNSAGDLAQWVDRATYPRFVAALVRCELAGSHADIVNAAPR